MAEELKEENERPVPKIGTDCMECCFFHSDNKTCHIGRLDKFVEQGAEVQDVDGKYLVERICLFRRTDAWKKSERRRRNLDQAASDVSKEVQICGTIVVYADNLDSLDECFQSLRHAKYIENFNIVVAHYDDLKIQHVFNYIQKQEYLENVMAIKINESEEGTNFLDEAIKRAKNGFVVTIDSDKRVDQTILEKLQKYVYDEMRRLIYVPPTDGVHECVIFGVIYKYLKGNRFWTFDEKIKELSKEQGLDDQITTWEKINESIG